MSQLYRAALAVFAAVIAFSAAVAQERVVPRTEEAIRYSFAPIVKQVSPAVVNVYASRTVRQRNSPFMDDPFFRRFFGLDDAPAAPRSRVQQSLGSGVIVDPSGIIVTNNHVIENADEVKVALSDRRELECEIVLKDERTDLAILRIKEKGTYPTLAFADSDALEVGDIVLAIGNPFGVGQTVTSGIVSALARTQVGVSDYQFFIQTDAAINPGNSGGALIDVDGRLVGINTAIYSRSGGSMGIGFAIPANLVRVVADAAKSGGAVKRPWIGADFQALNGELAEGLGLDRPRGALVTALVPGGPAERAGLAAGDVVVAVDGLDVDDPNALNYRLATRGVGGAAELRYLRKGRERTATLALEAAPETVPRDERTIDGGSPFAGLTVVNLSPAVTEELGYRGRQTSGALVTAVADGSNAADVGFRPGDVLVEINRQPVETTAALAQIARQRIGLWRVSIERGGRIVRSVIGG
ncbi:DegQ family serine endoprotease [Prosthecomicrobium pneumaticum]|uniref:Do/DeqQ family serine protease n=1 Tax=Prosthecomicrobium pneumaticum TaxID=81895 RepID=A0A7W9FP38_9HYPH|nr:DegQ family serine endoprotease [Prosthecomicrobium pneumaticum]MBB5754217.1 Do/DeqQ family serine protease [Prosthecomicrobium pneumaticum]